ncbi:MAG: hypothetical protein K2N05_00155 [Muribaculaceae bacterium]|nr:hypothetical protein [Muribaculaceae bacterium]
MHIAYAGLGDYENAYKTLLKGNELRDTIWEKEKAESLRDLTVKYNTKETELALAQSEARKANILMWLFISLGILLTMGILFVLYASRQKRRRIEKEMEFTKLRAEIGTKLTKQYLQGLESERKRMAGELHDGVCNDLLAVEMNLRNRKSVEEAAKQISICRDSVRRISHELLPPEFTYATLDEVVRHFIRKQQEANAGTITFEYNSSSEAGDWSLIKDDLALEIYRIVQEAVGNAVKYSGADTISISLVKKRDQLNLEVCDNGHFKNSGKKESDLNSIRRRANSINGDIELELSENHGTQIILRVETDK